MQESLQEGSRTLVMHRPVHREARGSIRFSSGAGTREGTLSRCRFDGEEIHAARDCAQARMTLYALLLSVCWPEYAQ